jgi:hypothetical protein
MIIQIQIKVIVITLIQEQRILKDKKLEVLINGFDEIENPILNILRMKDSNNI